jgi:hypothetical protein
LAQWPEKPRILTLTFILSKRPKKERELAFCGDIDFIPTEEYTFGDSREAMGNANFVVRIARRVIK